MTTALASKQGALNPLKAADPQDVLNRVLSEESTKDIAASFGVTRSALNYWLIQHCDTEWKAAQYIRAAKRKDEAEDELEIAADPLALAKAREKLRAAQWDLERVCRRIYGQDAPSAAQAVQINISLRRNEIEAETKKQPDDTLTLAGTHENHVRPQHYDSEAVQHSPITPGSSVDNSGK